MSSGNISQEATADGQPAHLSGVDRFGLDWRGQRVLVVGMARSGLAACRLLHRVGCHVRISERHETAATLHVAQQLREAGVERIELGAHSQEILDGCDAVVVSPGVPESALPVRWACERGLPVVSEIELAFRFCQAPVVAVTGTNGKSSVVTLIHRVLAAQGRRSVACGNIGIPFSSLIEALSSDMVAVVEVSSFQLTWCEEFRPAVGVLLNLGTNHLDWHADSDGYAQAKARLFRRQTPQDYAVLNAADPAVAAIGQRVRSQRVWFGADADGQLEHFRVNAATRRALPGNFEAVLQVARVLGLPDPLTYQVIREFKGLEHRTEYVATVRGVRFINDSKSTTPDSSLYALRRCAGPVIPILGGRNKGLSFEALRPVLGEERVRAVILIGETRASLKTLLDGAPRVQECETLDQAVRCAMAAARAGDTVLFSPGCASFDMFRNFEERGTVFKGHVRQLAEELADQRPGAGV